MISTCDSLTANSCRGRHSIDTIKMANEILFVTDSIEINDVTKITDKNEEADIIR